MSIIGNKRVTQLVELTAGEVQFDDLFYIIDISSKESKKIKANQLASWLNSSGSIFAFHAITSDTSSYILASNIFGLISSSSYATSASISLFTNISSQSLNSVSASYALTASYALNGNSSGSNTNTSSYLLYSGSPNGTSSYALNALTANTSNITSFLLYLGGDNGTASYAIKTQNVQHATTADTASFLTGAGSTASYALLAATSSISNTTDFLTFSPNNGTASYAMTAKGFAGSIINYGIFLVTTQSTFQSQLDDVEVFWTTTASANTVIEAVGTVIVPFTSSAPTNGNVYLSIKDRSTGLEVVIDSTPVVINLSPTMGTWGNYDSGTVKIPFSLSGQSSLYGSYVVFVSASNGVQIEPSRTTRFNISSQSDMFSVSVMEPLIFIVTPSDTQLFTYTTFAGGPFTTDLSGLLVSGSSNILTLSAINQGIVSMRYFWTLNNLTASNISNNPLLNLGGVPNSLTYFSCSNCSLTSLHTFKSSSVGIFNCSFNSLSSLPDFPASMSYMDCSNNQLTSLNLPLTLSYLNCSNNQITSLPTPFPSGSYILRADNNNLSTLNSFPNTIVSMSFNDNISLTTLPLSLPSNLVYFSINNCPVGNLPIPLPSSSLYFSLQSCSLFPSNMDDITSNLASYGLLTGSLDIRGNGPPSVTAMSNLSVLANNDWTLLYDM